MRVWVLILLLFFILTPVSFAEGDVVLKTGIVLEDNVPDALFGVWRIQSKLLETNAKGFFKNDNIDMWNISRRDSVITLDNPFSGAKASISIKEVNGNKVVFEKEGHYDNKILSDTVELYLDGNQFKGYNYLELRTVSEVDGHVMSTQNAKYSLNGDKITGYNVLIEEK